MEGSLTGAKTIKVLVLTFIVVGLADGWQESRQVLDANVVLAEIGSGKPVYYYDVIIEGEFNSKNFPNEQINITSYKADPSSTKKVVNSPIKILGSEIRGKVDFNRVIFLDEVDFGGTNFTDTASFSSSKFSRNACFSWGIFSIDANFVGAEFDDNGDFSNAQFKGGANFRNSKFRGSANFGKVNFSTCNAGFEGVNFIGFANFNEANFSSNAEFRDAKLGDDCNLVGAEFNGDANFIGAEFSGDVHASQANFSGDVKFNQIQFLSAANFGDVNFSGNAEFDETQFHKDANFEGANFNNNADFNGTQFHKDVDFSGTGFNGNGNFVEAQFSGDANFEGADFNKTVTFEEANFRGYGLFEGSNFSNTSTLCLNRTQCDKKIRLRWNEIAGDDKLPIIWWDDINSKLAFEEEAYLTLYKNYRDLGWFEDANKCYFEYMKQRKCDSLTGDCINKVLHISYGYGTKPEYSLYWSVALIAIFGVIWSRTGIRGAIFEIESTNRGAGFRNRIAKIANRKGIARIADPFIFSAKIFLSGTKLFVDPPKYRKPPGWRGSVIRTLFISERTLGMMLFFLFIFAISASMLIKII